MLSPPTNASRSLGVMKTRGNTRTAGRDSVGKMRAAIASLERTQRELAPLEAMQEWRLRAQSTYIRRASQRVLAAAK